MLKADLLKYLETHVADDEPVFLLRAQDQIAPKGVNDWAGRCMSNGKVPIEKINDGINVEMQMVDWQERNPDKVKLPD